MNTINNFNHTRSFGIELELFGVTRVQVKETLTAIGVDSWISGAEIRNAGWKITTDSSIHLPNWRRTPRGEGVELVSPILSGRDGLLEVKKVVKAIQRAGAKVNKSCGFHVHVDARDLSGSTMINALRRYAQNERQIDTFMPPSRQVNANTYCRTTIELAARFLGHETSTAQNIANLAYDEQYTGTGYIGGRYHKLNLCAWLRHGTVEFRHHSSTVNYKKVINWIMFCVNFMEQSTISDDVAIFQGLDPEVVEYFNQRSASTTTAVTP
jgi:hypothetical protein